MDIGGNAKANILSDNIVRSSSSRCIPIGELRVQSSVPARQPKKVQYIENPLPLPKKHIKRVMDYSLKEMPDEDDFDLDIGDEDDFDY